MSALAERYLVFAGAAYYPAGGWEDFLGSFDDRDAAVKAAEETITDSYSWAHVVDVETREVVWERG